MEIKQLNLFIAVAKNLSFNKTAQHFPLTSSAIRRIIRALEDELEVTLFIRKQRKLLLTKEGYTFLEEAKKIVYASEKARSILKKPAETSTIKIGVMPLTTITFLPPFLDRIQKDFPKLNIEITTFYSNQEILRQLHETQLDVVFYNQTYPQKNIYSHLVYEDDIQVIQSVNSPFAHLPEITIEELPKLTYILPPREVNPYLINSFFDYCQACGFTPNVAYYMNPHQARLVLASEGLGVTLDSASLKKLQVPNLVFTPLEKSLQAKVRILMGWKPQNPHRYLIEHFIRHLEAVK